MNAQHHRAIALLAEGMSNKQTAEALSIAPETVSRYKSDADFKEELNSVLLANKEASADRLNSLAGVALDTIKELMTDKNTPPKERLTASLKVIELINLAPVQAAVSITNNVSRDFNSFYAEDVLEAIKRKHAE